MPTSPSPLTGLDPARLHLPEKPALEGLEAKWTPRWEADAVYRFDASRPRSEVYSIDTPPPTVSGSLHVGHVFSYTHTDANQVHTQFFAPTTYKVPAQDQINLNVDWESVGNLPVDLSFFMTNVTNEKRESYPIATYQTTGAESIYLNMPRMWGFRLKYRFGD